MMKKIMLIISCAVIVCLVLSSSSNKVSIAIYCNDNSFYSEAIKSINKLGAVEIIERKDLKLIVKEIALQQSGLIKKKTANMLKSIDYIVIMKRNKNQYSAKIVYIKDGRIRDSFSGNKDSVLKGVLFSLNTIASFKVLSTLKSSDDGISIEITPFKGKTSYKYGDIFKFYIESESDGYLYVLDVDPHNNITILMPYGPFKQFKIKADKRICIPDDLRGPNGEKLFFKIKKPAGRERIKVFVAKKPINIHQLSGVMKGYMATVNKKNNNNFIRGISVTMSTMDNSTWGTADLEIKISPK